MPATYKVLGQDAPTGTSEVTIYTVPSGKMAVLSTIVLANVTHLGTAADIFATVRIRPAGAAAVAKHIIVPGALIRARTALTLTIGGSLNQTDVISVTSSVANGLAVTVFGTELP